MNVIKKVCISIAWIATSIAAVQGFRELRKFGTTAINNAGFFRLIGLSLFLVLFVAVPTVLAVLSWFNRPTTFYKKMKLLP